MQNFFEFQVVPNDFDKVFCYNMFEESIVLHQSARVASTVYSLAETSHFLHSNEKNFVVVSD